MKIVALIGSLVLSFHSFSQELNRQELKEAINSAVSFGVTYFKYTPERNWGRITRGCSIEKKLTQLLNLEDQTKINVRCEYYQTESELFIRELYSFPVDGLITHEHARSKDYFDIVTGFKIYPHTAGPLDQSPEVEQVYQTTITCSEALEVVDQMGTFKGHCYDLITKKE